jgi:hypothetical protein
MIHRHLNHQNFTLAAIDDIIARGTKRDWSELRRAALSEKALLLKIQQICAAQIPDPYAQRYHFWNNYANHHLA